jgi:hypothetical protein
LNSTPMLPTSTISGALLITAPRAITSELSLTWRRRWKWV